MLWTREEYLSHMTFQGSPREMFVELFGPLIGLDHEWRSQGASEDEISLRAFGFDGVKYAWIPFDLSPRSGIEPRILSDNETETVSIDNLGRKMRLSKKCATLPLPFSYPVQTPDDWYRIRDWYKFDVSRLNVEELKKFRRLQSEGTLILLSMPGGFDAPRTLMGEENLCCAYYDEPEMVRDMLNVFGDLMKKGLERILEYTGIDVLSVHEDMAGISGPLAGPKQVREFIAPYYQSVWNLSRQGGAALFSQDSDGNMNAVIDEFLACGVNCMYPLEPKAGMDMKALREKYADRLAFKGGIDKFALRGTKKDIDRELDYKLSAPLLGGGTIFGLDHRIPDGVPIENYRYYVSEARKRLNLTPIEPCDHIRMAF